MNFKKLKKIVKILWNIEETLEKLEEKDRFLFSRINTTNRTISEITGTEFAVDVHHTRPSIIIAIGKFRGNDYIKVFTPPSQDSFVDLVEHLRYLEKTHGHIRRVDAYPPYLVNEIKDTIYW